MRNGQLDQPALAVGQPVQLGGRLVTENGARSGADSPPQSSARLAARPGKRGIDTPVHYLPAAAAHLIPNVPSGHSSLKSLPNGKNPALAINQPKVFTRELHRHATSMRKAHTDCESNTENLWIKHSKDPSLWITSP